MECSTYLRHWLKLGYCRTNLTTRGNQPFRINDLLGSSGHWRFSNCFCSAKTNLSCNGCSLGFSLALPALSVAMVLRFRSTLKPHKLLILRIFSYILTVSLWYTDILLLMMNLYISIKLFCVNQCYSIIQNINICTTECNEIIFY